MLERTNSRLHETCINIHLNELEKITEKITHFSELVKKDKETKFLMKMENGLCSGKNIFSKEEVAISDFFITKGSKFYKHYHNSLEYLIIYKGEMTITIYDSNDLNSVISTSILKEGDCFKIEKNTFHSHEYNEDSSVLAITIPRDTGF